jgi:hypothetical protein
MTQSKGARRGAREGEMNILGWSPAAWLRGVLRKPDEVIYLQGEILG